MSLAELLRPKAERDTEQVVTVADLISRCNAAARMNLRGDRWSREHRIDCAAGIAARVIAEDLAARTAPRGCDLDGCRGVADRYSAPLDLALCEWHADYLPAVPAVRGRPMFRRTLRDTGLEVVNADLCTFGRLSGMAANYRAAEVAHDSRVKRTNLADLVRGQAAQDDRLERESHWRDGTPREARARAIDVLDSLGAARLGKLYPMAYAAVRTEHGLTAAEAAAELGLDPATFSMWQSRIRTGKLVHEGNFTLSTDDSGKPARVPMAKRERRPSLPSATAYSVRDHAWTILDDDSTRPASKRGALSEVGLEVFSTPEPRRDPAPITVRTVAPEPANPPNWTHDLPATTRARLEYASKASRARVAKLSEAELDARRAEAGIAQAS